MINDRELRRIWFIVSVVLSFYFYNKKQNKLKRSRTHESRLRYTFFTIQS